MIIQRIHREIFTPNHFDIDEEFWTVKDHRGNRIPKDIEDKLYALITNEFMFTDNWLLKIWIAHCTVNKLYDVRYEKHCCLNSKMIMDLFRNCNEMIEFGEGLFKHIKECYKDKYSDDEMFYKDINSIKEMSSKILEMLDEGYVVYYSEIEMK